MKDAEWNESYALMMPMLGVVIGVFGVALSILTLKRQQALGGLNSYGVDIDVPKVRYSGGDIYLEVREPGRWLPMTGFVQPDDPMVRQIVNNII